MSQYAKQSVAFVLVQSMCCVAACDSDSSEQCLDGVPLTTKRLWTSLVHRYVCGANGCYTPPWGRLLLWVIAMPACTVPATVPLRLLTRCRAVCGEAEAALLGQLVAAAQALSSAEPAFSARGV